MNIALLGTGLLGQAVAERLHAADHSLSAYNRSPEKTRSLRQCGIRITPTAEEAMSSAEVVLLLLSDAPAIRAVLFDPATSGAIERRTIIQMGTIGPSESRSIQREIERFGGRYLEAPVLGSIAEAHAGSLLIMVGATPEQYAEHEPLLRTMGSEVHLIGPVGKAAVLKLALNQLIASEMAAFALSLGLIRREGVAVESFMRVLRKSALYAPMFDKKLPRLSERNYDNPNFSTRHLLKDVELVLNAAETTHLATGGLQGIRSLLTETIAQGLGAVDYSAIYEVIDPAEG
ncbi:MAG: NAD(P)-dependent oxidoreductase [Nitrospira defluvii]|nr:NAD(P)-dependent oxidoreductase [Nitrospira defluvii]